MTLEFTMRSTITSTDLGRAHAAILRPEGALDQSNYDRLIVQAWAAQDAGARDLIVDLRDVERVETAGLMGLYAVARLAHRAPPDPELSWAGRALAEDQPSRRRLAVVNPRPSIRQVLAGALFTDYLAIHADLDAALAALTA
jgi:anti-anti-sigma regulatory factor